VYLLPDFGVQKIIITIFYLCIFSNDINLFFIYFCILRYDLMLK